LLKAHTSHNFDAVAAKVKLEPCGSKARKPLDNGNIVAKLREPECEGVTCDAATADEYFERCHVLQSCRRKLRVNEDESVAEMI
jgi:hypothetical protein